MANLFLWVGLTFIIAVNPFLIVLGLNASDVIVSVGAILMVIGAFLLLFDRYTVYNGGKSTR